MTHVYIQIVSFARDVEYCELAVRSLAKFATGFRGCVICVPQQDRGLFRRFARERMADGAPIAVVPHVDWHERSHLLHNITKCYADVFCPDAQHILHTDSDCIFTEPVTPADYFEDEQPIMLVDRWENVGNAQCWREPVERALGITTAYETMRRHPAVHPAEMYGRMRAHIEALHRLPFVYYVLAQRNQFPYGFCEFSTMGNYALRFMPFAYRFVDLSLEPAPRSKLIQGWSKHKIEDEQRWREELAKFAEIVK